MEEGLRFETQVYPFAIYIYIYMHWQGGRKWLLAVAGFQEFSYIKMSRILLPNHCIFAADHI